MAFSPTSFQNAWDNTDPDGQTVFGYQIDDKIKNFKIDLEDRLRSMFYGFNTGTSSGYQSEYGVRHLRFLKQDGVNLPSYQSGTYEAFLLSSLSSAGNMDMIWRAKGADGTAAQRIMHNRFFNVDLINTNALNEGHFRATNNAYIKALNAAGSAEVDLIKASADDLSVLPDGAQLAAATQAADPDRTISDKKYAEDLVAKYGTMVPACSAAGSGYAAEESITFQNGLIMKQGSATYQAGTTDWRLTFAAAFPTDILRVSVTVIGAASGGYAPVVSSKTAAGVVIEWNGTTSYTMDVVAWGY